MNANNDSIISRSKGALSKRVEGIYRVEKKESPPDFSGARKLLWHGTKVSNLLSILTTGLQVNPTFAPITGRAFGDGLYFADVYDKSQSYTRSSGSSEYLLLCEVDLGRCLEVNNYSWYNNHEIKEKALKYDSVHVLGKHVPEDTGSVVSTEGYTLPLGKIVRRKSEEENTYSHWGLEYSEYVVRKETKVAVRFIVKIGTGEDSSDDFNASIPGDNSDDEMNDDDNESFASTDSS